MSGRQLSATDLADSAVDLAESGRHSAGSAGLSHGSSEGSIWRIKSRFSWTLPGLPRLCRALVGLRRSLPTVADSAGRLFAFRETLPQTLSVGSAGLCQTLSHTLFSEDSAEDCLPRFFLSADECFGRHFSAAEEIVCQTLANSGRKLSALYLVFFVCRKMFLSATDETCLPNSSKLCQTLPGSATDKFFSGLPKSVCQTFCMPKDGLGLVLHLGLG